VARYPNISDHGLIGDLQTAALVTTDGVVDWFCCPRFDSPSVFASLLDAEHGGFYRIAPDRDDYVSRQLYLPDTGILVTRFTQHYDTEVLDSSPLLMPLQGFIAPATQAFSHLSLISAAINLDHQLDHGPDTI
jgi:GH15 family glucan-1,4-alpha-glucosidase